MHTGAGAAGQAPIRQFTHMLKSKCGHRLWPRFFGSKRATRVDTRGHRIESRPACSQVANRTSEIAAQARGCEMADAVFWQRTTLQADSTSDCAWLPPLVQCGSSGCHSHGFLLRASCRVFAEHARSKMNKDALHCNTTSRHNIPIPEQRQRTSSQLLSTDWCPAPVPYPARLLATIWAEVAMTRHITV